MIFIYYNPIFIYAITKTSCRYDWQQLGRLPNCDRYCDVKRYQTAETKSDDNVAVISFNAPLIFTNVEIFKKIIRNTADDNKTSALENDETNDKNMNDDYENQVNNCLSSIIQITFTVD
jgi:MFS superfamily sulfate permease-like transporter